MLDGTWVFAFANMAGSAHPILTMLGTVTALCRLDGAGLAVSDLRALGFDPSESSGAIVYSAIAEGIAEKAGITGSERRVSLLAGHPSLRGWRSDDLSPVALMQSLFDRHGDQLPAQVDGEWIFLDWRPGKLAIALSRQRRDWLFVARQGNKLALSSDVLRLAALDWVGRDLDTIGTAAALGRSPLRAALSGKSILPGVERLEPGSCTLFETGGDRRSRAAMPAISKWEGSFADAVEAARDVLATILGERLDTATAPGVLLSGGLDSSTLAALLVAANRSGSGLTAFTSVAPHGSGLPDERTESSAVARHLGINQITVTPDVGTSPFRPHEDAFRLAGGPTLSPRHYLYRELASVARDTGADVLFEGSFGELTLTSFIPLRTPAYRLRRVMQRVVRGKKQGSSSLFHARLAPHREHAISLQVREFVDRVPAEKVWRDPGELWGWVSGYDKAWETPSLIDHGIRFIAPFRDPRLLQLFAGFPASFLVQEGLNRAPARAMMQGMLPESIRLRRSVGPFSPDYMQRLRDHAEGALQRIALFRRAEADDWLDIDWLEQSLRRISSAGPASVAEAFEIQLTAMAAEFLVWWRGVD